MNWKKLLLNIAGASLVGVGGVFSAFPTGTPITGRTLGAAAGTASIAALIGLFQHPPHVDGEQP